MGKTPDPLGQRFGKRSTQLSRDAWRGPRQRWTGRLICHRWAGYAENELECSNMSMNNAY